MTSAFVGELTHADACELAGRHAQRQLLLVEGDDKEFERHAGDFLLLDADDTADTVRGIDDEFIGLEAVTLADRLLLHSKDLTRGGGLLGNGFRRYRLLSGSNRSRELLACRLMGVGRHGNGALRRRSSLSGEMCRC